MTCPAGILQDQSGVLDRKEADTLLRGARCDGLVCRCMVTLVPCQKPIMRLIVFQSKGKPRSVF